MGNGNTKSNQKNKGENLMTTETNTNGKKVRVHTIYKNKEGKRVPGVTTALGLLNKPALIHWAWKLGIEGIDYKTFRDDKADIGTLTHLMALSYEKDEKPDTDYYTKAQIDLAETCFLKYLAWRDKGQTRSKKYIFRETVCLGTISVWRDAGPLLYA